MLNDYTFAALNSVQNCIGKHSHLRECRLEAYVKMISVRSKKTLLLNVKNRKRASVHSVIIVCQLEPGEHAFYQHALARACLADNADKLIKRAEIQYAFQDHISCRVLGVRKRRCNSGCSAFCLSMTLENLLFVLCTRHLRFLPAKRCCIFPNDYIAFRLPMQQEFPV